MGCYEGVGRLIGGLASVQAVDSQARVRNGFYWGGLLLLFSSDMLVSDG